MKNNEAIQRRGLVVVVVATTAPLLVALMAHLLPEYAPFDLPTTNRLTIGYAALLLTYFAGARLGIFLQTERTNNKGVWLALAGPALALVTLSLPFRFALATLIVGFGAQGAWDAWSAFRGKLRLNYSSMRSTSTGIICFILIVTLLVVGEV